MKFVGLLTVLLVCLLVVCHAQKDKAIDSDNDGLTDAEEIKLGTNPFDSDSDDDGIPDGVEALKDSDGDGINDALENVDTELTQLRSEVAQLKAKLTACQQGQGQSSGSTKLGSWLKARVQDIKNFNFKDSKAWKASLDDVVGSVTVMTKQASTFLKSNRDDLEDYMLVELAIQPSMAKGAATGIMMCLGVLAVVLAFYLLLAVLKILCAPFACCCSRSQDTTKTQLPPPSKKQQGGKK